MNAHRQPCPDCARLGIAYQLKQLGGHPDARAHDKALLDGRLHVEFPSPSDDSQT